MNALQRMRERMRANNFKYTNKIESCIGGWASEGFDEEAEQAAAELEAMKIAVDDWMEVAENIQNFIHENKRVYGQAGKIDLLLIEYTKSLEAKLATLRAKLQALEWEPVTGDCLTGCGGNSIDGHEAWCKYVEIMKGDDE